MNETKTKTKSDIEGMPLDEIPEDVQMGIEPSRPRSIDAVAVPEDDGSGRIDQMLIRQGIDVEQFVKRRAEILEQLEMIAIRKTHPQDWTLFKDRDGKVVGVLRDSGCVQVRKIFGISIYNHRPNVGGFASPKVTVDRVPIKDNPTKTQEVHVAEMYADARCRITGEEEHDIYFAVRTVEDGRKNFVGRGHIQDLKASCRTGIDSKAVRILSGLRKVPLEKLEEAGIDVSKCYLGSGYGSGSERTAQRVTDAGAADAAKALWDKLLQLTGGSEDDAAGLLKEITSFKGKDGKTHWAKSYKSLTLEWQVKQAWENLRKHPDYGDAVG